MTLWRWAAVAALGIFACAWGFGAIPGINACGVGGDPILAFEFVTKPADVAALFPDHCRYEHAEAQAIGLWFDGLVFIPVYSAFLILNLLALKREGGTLAAKLPQWGILAVIAAAAADQFEGLQLFRLLETLPGTQGVIDLLMPAVRGKFALLSLVAIAVAALHFASPALWRKVAAAIIALASLWSLLGLFTDFHRVMQGSGIAWLAMIAAVFVLAFRRAPAVS